MTDFYESLALWSQVAASILFLCVLVWLFVRFVTPAVRASQERKNAELVEAERRRDAAQAEVAVAQAELAATDGDVQAIGARSERDAERERQRLIAAAKADGERQVRNAEGELGRGRAAARDLLREELLERALAIARGAAARIDDGANQRLIGEALAAAERGDGT